MKKAAMKKTRALANENHMSMSQVYKVVKFIQSEIGKRYPAGSVIHNSRSLMVREDVFRDALENMDAIHAGNAPEFEVL